MKEALVEVKDFIFIIIFTIVINSRDMFIIFWLNLNVTAIFAPNRWIL